MMPMRRADREVTEPAKIQAIFHDAAVCRLAFSAEDAPYIVPLSFGWQQENGEYVLYFHGANAGRKLELLKQNPHVGFELDCGYALKPAELACGFSAAFRSIIGTGTLEALTDPADKRAGLTCLMAHYSPRRDWAFPEEMLARICVLRLRVTSLCGKEHE